MCFAPRALLRSVVTDVTVMYIHRQVVKITSSTNQLENIMARPHRITFTSRFDYYGRGEVRLKMGSKHIKLESNGQDVTVTVDGRFLHKAWNAKVQHSDNLWYPNPEGHAYALAMFVSNCVNSEGEEMDMPRREYYDFLMDCQEDVYYEWYQAGIKAIEELAFRK